MKNTNKFFNRSELWFDIVKIDFSGTSLHHSEKNYMAIQKQSKSKCPQDML